jgi:hypothetical protein
VPTGFGLCWLGYCSAYDHAIQRKPHQTSIEHDAAQAELLDFAIDDKTAVFGCKYCVKMLYEIFIAIKSYDFAKSF